MNHHSKTNNNEHKVKEYKIVLPQQSSSSNNVYGFLANNNTSLAVIICHPWGPLGGNAHDPIVMCMTKYFQEKLSITTFRLNFGGLQIGTGWDQVDQVIDAANFLLHGRADKYGNNDDSISYDGTEERGKGGRESNVKYIMLVGYSYGSLIIGTASSNIKQCIGTISIGPPYGVMHWLLLFFQSRRHMIKSSERKELPRLLILGDEDNFTGLNTFWNVVKTNFPGHRSFTWNDHHEHNHTSFSNLFNNSKNNSSDDDTYRNTMALILPEVDHFSYRRRQLIDVVQKWLTEAYNVNNINNLKAEDLSRFIKYNNNNNLM